MIEILKSLAIPLVVMGMSIAAFAVLVMFARNYRKCPPNKVLVVYGRKKGDKGYRLITGGSAFVVPLLESYQYIDLETFSVQANVEKTPNVDGVPVNVQAIANIKVSSDPAKLAAAVERVLGKRPEEINTLLKNTLDGLLRQIIGTLTIEDMVKDREKLNQGVLQNATTEMNKLGFALDNFVINKLWDDEGYIEAMGAKRTAEVKRDAKIAQAEADRESTVKSSQAKREGEQARLAAEELIAQANRDLSLKQAGFKKETETAQAEADMAGELKKAEVQKDLNRRRVEADEANTKARIGLAEQEAIRIEKELDATVIKPAQAESRAATIKADGNASAAVKQAEATKIDAEAKKVKLTLEGEGAAAASAAAVRATGEAEAAAARAKGEANAAVVEANGKANAAILEANGKAEGAAIQAKGEAEGVSIRAKLVAEADGLLKKNEALAQMSEGAKFILILEKLPEIIDEVGEAGQKIIAAAFEQVGAGLSRIDSVHIVDMGGGGSNGRSGVAKFAGSIPEIVFETVAKFKAAGIDISSVLEKVGIPKGALEGLLSNITMGVGRSGDAEDPVSKA